MFEDDNYSFGGGGAMAQSSVQVEVDLDSSRQWEDDWKKFGGWYTESEKERERKMKDNSNAMLLDELPGLEKWFDGLT